MIHQFPHSLLETAVITAQAGGAEQSASSGGFDWALVPVGGLFAGLVALFGMFIRDSARNDERADANAAKMIGAAEAERDRARDDLAQERAAHAAVIADMERAHARSKSVLYERIRHLESLVYGTPRTPPPPPDPDDDADDGVPA